MPYVPYSALEWARENGERFEWFAIGNGYPETDRRCGYISGEGFRYANEHTYGDTRVILFPEGPIRDAHNAFYLLDDGRAVAAYYVAGWNDHDDRGPLYLHPIPTDYNADGTRRVRADNGRPVSFADYRLNPARAYHVKVRNDQ